MLINLSNHPSANWTAKQFNAAVKKYSEIIDLPFPHISPHSTKSQVIKKAKSYSTKCVKLIDNSSSKPNALHIMGELTFTFYLVNILKSKKIKCIASTTKRLVEEVNQSKTSYFQFIRFREY